MSCSRLLRPIAAKRLGLIGLPPRQILQDYIEAVDLVTPLAVPPVVAADRDDDQVIAAAVAAQADLIVSDDRHLLALRTCQGIRIVAPAEALEIIIA